MTPCFAQLALLGKRIGRELTYLVPEDLRDRIQLGCRALVPIGVRWETGIVVGLSPTTDLPRERLKAVGELLDPYPLLDSDLLQLCRWIASYYLCALSEVLTAALPAGIHVVSGQHVALSRDGSAPAEPLSQTQRAVLAFLESVESASVKQIQRKVGGIGAQSAVCGLVRRGLLTTFQKMVAPKIKTRTERTVELRPEDPRWFETEWPILARRAPRQADCLRQIREAGGSLRVSELLDIGPSVLNALSHRSLIRFGRVEKPRDPFAGLEADPAEAVEPNPDQKAALERITCDLDRNRFGVSLLHGVTGSGKTLIYIHAVSRALSADRGAIVLVPEITLTPQTVRRFRARFGDRVAVLHSALSQGERFDAWRAVREGKKSVVIGARSAVFAPVRRLGLIVIDEEHDGSYKQSDPAPRYHARDVAVMRAKQAGIPIVLGSATPSLESYQNARIGKFELLTLPSRVDSRPMPEVTLVDMKEEGGGLFSKPLRQKIHARLSRGEGTILLQNRRGYAPTVQCGACGETLSCPHCQVTLTYHTARKQLLCHYCGLTSLYPEKCPACSRPQLQMLGVGTQRVEEALAEQFSAARVLRMDMDSTGRKGSHDRILQAFARGEADILLGTQMVAKGLDFPGVTLVGVISADTGLHLPDFRAAERTFQLLTQVSGRAGRGEIPGEVVVQTFRPESQAVQRAREHDFLGFANRELEDRKPVGYPPFGRMALFLFKGRDELEVARRAGECGSLLRAQAPPQVEVMGPVQAPIARLRQVYRWQVLLKSEAHAVLNGVCRQALDEMGNSRRVSLSLDIDPVSML